MNKLRRITALLLMLALLSGVFGPESFMALAAYADDEGIETAAESPDAGDGEALPLPAEPAPAGEVSPPEAEGESAAEEPPAETDDPGEEAGTAELPEPSESAVDAEGPETEGPETEGPETEGPETEGPETEGPETEGPETEGPETESPADGESAVSAVPETAAPTAAKQAVEDMELTPAPELGLSGIAAAEENAGAASAQAEEAEYAFPAATVALTDILAALNVSLTQNNYNVSADSDAVSLSANRVNKNGLAAFTLTAKRSFARVTLTLESTNGKDRHELALTYAAPAVERTVAPALEGAAKMALTGFLPEDARVEVTPVDVSVAGVPALAAYDIDIFDSLTGESWQPGGEAVTVALYDPAFSGSLRIYHLADVASEAEYVATVEAEDGWIRFPAASFSVYVVIGHEGGTVVNPRVEFHFIAPQEETSYTTAGSVAYYESTPYSFRNKAGDTQTSMIVHNGDKLESIEAPSNTLTSYFYGWYTVDCAGDTGGSIRYSWPDDTQRVELDNAVAVTMTQSGGTVDSITWTVNGVSQTVDANIDEDGCAHVYLAPIYDNYHFVNFHLGPRGESTASNIMTRKLIVLGNSQETSVLVSDIEAPSGDSVHKLFIGWERNTGTESSPVWELTRTVDDDGETIDNTSLTVGPETIDLYPHFVEIRWVNYNVGASHNGASYKSPKFMYTSDDSAGAHADDNALADLGAAARVGYDFGGWYVNVCMKDSVILNLNGPYTDPDTGRAWTQAVKIANADGSVVTGAAITAYSNASGDVVYTETPGYSLAYKVENGRLYVYTPLNELTVYADWQSQAVQYYIYFWKQNANDDNYTFSDYAVLAGNAGAVTAISGATSVTPQVDTSLGTRTISSLYTSEHFSLNTTTKAIEQKTVQGDNSTIVNVYFDRESYTLKFYFARSYTGSNGRSYLQVNNNNEGFTGTAYTNAESLVTALTKKNGTYDDYTRTGGMNTWKDVASDSITQASQLLSAEYLALQGVSIGTQSITTNTTMVANGGDTTSVDSQEMIYYYIQLDVKHGQSLAQLWPTASVFHAQTISNYNTESRNSDIYPIFWGAMGKGNVNASNTADAALVHNTADNEGYYLLYWRFQSTYKALFRVYFSALNGETADATYNGVSYVEQDGDPDTVQNLTGIVVSGVSDFSDVIATLYDGFTLQNGDANNKISSTASNGTYNGTDYTRVFNAYYKRNEHSVILQTNVVSSDSITDGTKTTGNIPIASIPCGESLNLQRIRDTVPDWVAGTTVKTDSSGAVYKFSGWYDNPGGSGEPIDFSSTAELMPDRDVTYYAVWSITKFRVKIDPNGGVMDHINYDAYAGSLIGTGLENHTGYNASYATYFNNTSSEYINTDGEIQRPYVQITDAEAATMAAGTVYRYVNMQFIQQYGSYAADARNAVYILDTEASISAYYNYYRQVIADARDGTALPRSLWESLYLSSAKYRQLHPGESYKLLGWYEVNADGTVAASPFDFSRPTDHETTLRALWRLDGGYTVQYSTEYYAPNNDYITGNLETWMDPSDGTKYADGATTQAMQEPMAIKVNGEPSDAYQFRGWQIVSVTTVGGVPQYTALEPGVYYTAGQPLTVQAKYADDGLIVHMQAVYELREDAYRRPDVISLTLDASEDAAHAGTGSVDASNGAWPTWTYPGHYYSDSTHIYFGDTQSNTAVHLYRYATALTNSEATGAALNPAGVNFFEHSVGYRLIGFDLDKADTNFIPDYAADAVVAVAPGESHTLYAVWEPMVYLTLVNNVTATADGKDGSITVTLSTDSAHTNALYVVNQANGSFSRVPADAGGITIPKGETVRLAIPYGEGATITVEGTNSLGTNCIMTISDMLGSNGSQTKIAEYANGARFEVDETLLVHEEGRYVVFTSEKKGRTIILNDNYGDEPATAELYYEEDEVSSEPLPNRGRVGYVFEGWSENASASTATYAGGSSIASLNDFFGESDSKTLYAIWTSKAEARTVYVYKNVPPPGDQTQQFLFRVTINGYYANANNASSGTNLTNYQDVALTAGQYIKIIANDPAERGYNPTVSATLEVYDANDTLRNSYALSASASISQRRYSFFSNITVTESDYAGQYNQAYEIAGDLYLTGNTAYRLQTNGDRSFKYNYVNCGGTVIFTNTRKTADVTIRKTLLPDTLDPQSFTFTASLEDGESYTLSPTSRTIRSGASGAEGEWVIPGIPTGAKLTITENLSEADAEKYDTAAVSTSDPTGEGYTAETRAYTLTVEKDTVVTFTNTLKKQYVWFVLVDDSSLAVDSATFNLSGAFSGEYAKEKSGTIWAGPLYAGDYTLSEVTPNRFYSPLENTATITVGGAVTASCTAPDLVTVTGGSGTEKDPFIVTIVNPKKAAITVTKRVTGDDTSGTFTFVATLTKEVEVGERDEPQQVANVIGTSGTDENGRIIFYLRHEGSETLYVPKGMKLVILELTEGYTTTTSATEGIIDGDDIDRSFTIDPVSVNVEVTFINEAPAIAPTLYSGGRHTGGYLRLLLMGGLLGLSALLPRRRRKEERDDG